MLSYLCYLRRSKCLLYIIRFFFHWFRAKIFFRSRSFPVSFYFFFPNYICFLFIILSVGLGLKISLLSFSIKKCLLFLVQNSFFSMISLPSEYIILTSTLFALELNFFILVLNLFESQVSLLALVLIFCLIGKFPCLKLN